MTPAQRLALARAFIALQERSKESLMSKYYECTECQRLHFAPSKIYDMHLSKQSKRGLMRGDSPSDIFVKWIIGQGAYAAKSENAYRVTYTKDGFDWCAKHIHPENDVKFPPFWSIHKSGISGPEACYQRILDTSIDVRINIAE